MKVDMLREKFRVLGFPLLLMLVLGLAGCETAGSGRSSNDGSLGGPDSDRAADDGTVNELIIDIDGDKKLVDLTEEESRKLCNLYTSIGVSIEYTAEEQCALNAYGATLIINKNIEKPLADETLRGICAEQYDECMADSARDEDSEETVDCDNGPTMFGDPKGCLATVSQTSKCVGSMLTLRTKLIRRVHRCDQLTQSLVESEEGERFMSDIDGMVRAVNRGGFVALLDECEELRAACPVIFE